MTEISDKIKAIGALDLTAGEKLIAITMALCKTSDTATLCELTGENRRAVQRARTAYLDLCDKSDSRDKRDTHVATVATDATPVSQPSRAYKESPSEIDSTEEKIDSPSSVPPKPKRSQARGARLPGDWTLPGPWAEWVRVNFPTVTEAELTREADTFRDYWIAKPGAQACKLDWEATWRNWCRKALSSAGRHRGGPAQPQHTAHWKDQARAERAKWVSLMAGGGVQ